MDVVAGLDGVDAGLDISADRRREAGHETDAGGGVFLRLIQMGQVDIGAATHDHLPHVEAGDHFGQHSLDSLQRDVQQGDGGGNQLVRRQAGMAVARVVTQGAQEGSFQPLGAVPFHVVILGDAVRVAEVQLQRLPAQQIGV